MSRKFKMRDRVKCNVTGFEGVVTGFTEYLNGCKQFCVKPTELTKDGKIRDGVWFDEEQIELVKASDNTKAPTPSGGPQMDEPPTH